MNDSVQGLLKYFVPVACLVAIASAHCVQHASAQKRFLKIDGKEYVITDEDPMRVKSSPNPNHFVIPPRHKVTPGPTPPTPPKSKTTTWSLHNGTGKVINFYITIVPVPNYTAPQITTTSQLTLTGKFAAGEGVITPAGAPTLGTFFLNPGTTAHCNPGETMSFNIFTNGQTGPNPNPNCVAGQGPGLSGIGATFVEMTINVNHQGGIGDEAVDISEVNGVNALYQVTLPLPAGNLANPPSQGGHYPEFFDVGGYQLPSSWPEEGAPLPNHPSWGNFLPGQLVPVDKIANHPGADPTYSGDRNNVLPYGIGNGNVGIYPMGCDNCTSRHLPGCSSANYPAQQLVRQHLPICTIFRNWRYEHLAGNIGITLLQFPYPH